MNRKKWEFSKVILAVVMLIYVISTIGIYIFVVVNDAREQLDGFMNFVGAPTSVAIGFYAWKAKNENLKKMDRPEEDENADE